MKKAIITSTNEGMKVLGITVIGDIKSAVHDALYSGIQLMPEYTDHTTLKECLTALIFWENQLKVEKNYKYIGPEMFRWLAFFSKNLKNRKIKEITHQLLELPELLFFRLIPYQKKIKNKLSFSIRLAYSGKGIRFIQLDNIIKKNLNHNGLVRIDMNKDECFLSCSGGVFPIETKEILNQLDGYRKDKKFWIVDKKVFLHQSGIILFNMVNELNLIASEPLSSNEELRIIKYNELFSVKYASIISTIKKGYKYIKKYAPSVYKETIDSLKGITLLNGKRFVGSSDIWYHGIALLNPDNSWSKITFADHLIHESAHTILHKINELTPLLLNPFDLLNVSPIRKDPRPLYGTFHATFVFMKLAQFFENVEEKIPLDKKQENIPKTDTEEVLFRLNRHIKGFYDGMQILAEHALFTNSGYRLFEEMNTYRIALLKRHPNPNYTKYQNAFSDYVI